MLCTALAIRKLLLKSVINLNLRYMPDESFEDWAIDELIITD